jgi:hypothetical protein
MSPTIAGSLAVGIFLLTAISGGCWLLLAGVDSPISRLAVALLVLSVPGATIVLLHGVMARGRNALSVTAALRTR